MKNSSIGFLKWEYIRVLVLCLKEKHLFFLDEVKLKKLLLDILVFLNFVISFGLIFFKISLTVIFPEPIAFINEFSSEKPNFTKLF